VKPPAYSTSSSPSHLRNIESFIIEKGFEEGWVYPQIAKSPKKRKVAVIGSGPAGLAAAQTALPMGLRGHCF
jgi:glutamate synthase (NADPH/NADH) small chain